jgi:hypothetical protein
MQSLGNALFGLSLCGAFALGLTWGCEKKETNSPDDEGKGGNLCKDYNTCDECIAGQQAKGVDEGEAETQCGAAVMGCWTTWKKPIVCGGKKHDEDPEAEAEE